MTLSLIIDGVDRTDLIWADTLKIEQSAREFTTICSVKLNDNDSSLDISARDTVVVDDDGTTLFEGEITNIDYKLQSLALDGRRIVLSCRDYHWLIKETVIDGENAYESTSDDSIIADLFSSYRADFDATTYVAEIEPSLSITFQDETLFDALEQISDITGGEWYVQGKDLHYFVSESNTAAWYLSDDPDDPDGKRYQNIRRTLRSDSIINRVLVVGENLRDWYEDAASIAEYGTREAVVVDEQITTQANLDLRGNALLERYAYPTEAYSITTREEGLRAGMDIRVVCDAWGLDDTFTIQRLIIRWKGNVRFYDLDVGNGIGIAAESRQKLTSYIDSIEAKVALTSGAVNDLDAPAAPNALTAGNVSTGVDLDEDGKQLVWAEVTWSGVSDADLNHYELQISTQADFNSESILRMHPSDGDRSERFTGLVGNTTYYVRVRAVDWVGNKSAWDYGGGSALSFTSSKDSVAPAQVVGVTASASRTLVGLSWTAGTEGDLRYYEIQRAPDSGGSPGAWATIATVDIDFYIDQDFTDAQISDEDTFWYRVRAVDTSGNVGSWSTSTSATLSQIVGDHIAAATIVGDHIAANTITAGKLSVSELSAIAADLGTITAGTVTGATIRTAASGQRVVLDSVDGIQAYNSSGVQTVSLDLDGSGFLGVGDNISWNTAGGVFIDGGAIVEGTISVDELKIAGRQMVVNPGFEDALVASIDDGWGSGYDGTRSGTAHSGSYGIEATGDGANIIDVSYQNLEKNSGFIRENDELIFDFWMKGSVATGSAKMGIVFYNSSDGVISWNNFEEDLTTAWQRVTAMETAPANVAYLQLRLQINADTTATVAFDDVHVRKKGGVVQSVETDLESAREFFAPGAGEYQWNMLYSRRYQDDQTYRLAIQHDVPDQWDPDTPVFVEALFGTEDTTAGTEIDWELDYNYAGVGDSTTTLSYTLASTYAGDVTQNLVHSAFLGAIPPGNVAASGKFFGDIQRIHTDTYGKDVYLIGLRFTYILRTFE